MKKFVRYSVSLLLVVLMINMGFIDARASDIIPYTKLKIGTLTETPILDVNEETIFSAIESKGTIEYFIFDFHDGSTPLVSRFGSVSHSFPYEGTYLVSLHAIGQGNLEYIATGEVIVRNDPPSGSIEMPSNAIEGEEVLLKAVNVVDSEIDIESLSYEWSLGDGRTVYGPTASVIWDDPAVYPVTLLIYDDQYAVHPETSYITIQNLPPIAHFTTNKEVLPGEAVNIYEDEKIIFNAESSSDTSNDMKTLRFYWDFGDGGVERGIVVEHSYSNAGTYLATLTVMDDDGAKSYFDQSINILNQKPTVSIPESSITINEGESYTFIANAEDTPTDYQLLDYWWSFGQEGWQVAHTWKDDWSGEVSVTVQDPEGLTDTDSVSVQVLNVPPSIQIDSAFVNTNLTITVSGYSGQSYDLNVYDDGILIISLIGIISEGFYSPVSRTLPILFDLSKSYQVEVKYSPGVTPIGKSYITLTYSFSDHTCYSLTHTFTSGSWSPW